MHDVSERFLRQLAADRRSSLVDSGNASSKRPLRRAVRAGLLRLRLVTDRSRGESASPRQQAPASHELEGGLRDSERLPGSAQSVVKPAGADVPRSPASRSPRGQ
jgi:hypothetical protein